MQKAMVKNAADEKQVKSAEKGANRKRDQELNDLRAILQMPEGRRFIARVLAYTRVHGSIWHQSAMIHKLAGAQEVGQFIMKEMVEANKKLAAEMFIEAYEDELGGDKDV